LFIYELAILAGESFPLTGQLFAPRQRSKTRAAIENTRLRAANAMLVELIIGIVLFLAGAANLIWAKQMSAYAARRNPWDWHRGVMLSSPNLIWARVIGAIIMVFGALLMWWSGAHHLP
jgi:hypothetical protein